MTYEEKAEAIELEIRLAQEEIAEATHRIAKLEEELSDLELSKDIWTSNPDK
jgi:predicted  nucleic acid-binding Zn-ribbon protein